MAGKSVKLFELCTKDTSQLFSPFCWRVRLACYHKGLEVETVPWKFTEKDRLKFANSDKVPVLVDGEKAVKESFEIARYLESAYPDAPTLFGGKAGEAAAVFADNFANNAIGYFFPILLVSIWEQLDKQDADYFRPDREKMFGDSLEDAGKDEEGKLKEFRTVLEPVRQTVQLQSFLGGDKPTYSDFTLVSIFLTAKAVRKLPLLESDDPVQKWVERVLAPFKKQLSKEKWEGSL